MLRNRDKSKAFISLGQIKYLSALKYVDAVIGNSSSGLIEAPSFKIGTINIGDRQKGRIKADSVINSKPKKESIKKALKQIYSKKFQLSLKTSINPYVEGSSSKDIIKVLKKNQLHDILKKEFFNINF